LERLAAKRTETGSCPSPPADGDYLCVHHLSFVRDDLDVSTVFTEKSLNPLKSTIEPGKYYGSNFIREALQFAAQAVREREIPLIGS
jgi:hypothetical protein